MRPMQTRRDSPVPAVMAAILVVMAGIHRSARKGAFSDLRLEGFSEVGGPKGPRLRYAASFSSSSAFPWHSAVPESVKRPPNTGTNSHS